MLYVPGATVGTGFKNWIDLNYGLQKAHGLLGESNKHILFCAQEVRRCGCLQGLAEYRQRAKDTRPVVGGKGALY